MGVCNCSMFCCTLLYVHSSIAIILMGKRELIALRNLSSWCLMIFERLFLAVPRGCLQFVIVVFPDHTHLLFLTHFSISHNFSLIIGLHLGRHLGYIEMLNDARVASLRFFKDNICTTRINQEKKFKIKFQVLQKFAQILLDYLVRIYVSRLTTDSK